MTRVLNSLLVVAIFVSVANECQAGAYHAVLFDTDNLSGNNSLPAGTAFCLGHPDINTVEYKQGPGGIHFPASPNLSNAFYWYHWLTIEYALIYGSYWDGTTFVWTYVYYWNGSLHGWMYVWGSGALNADGLHEVFGGSFAP